MQDDEITRLIQNLIFEDPKEEESARIVSRLPFTEPMRDWLLTKIKTNGAKYRHDKPKS